jgi:hypothetical protein
MTDLLIRAATLMRERAEGASWTYSPLCGDLAGQPVAWAPDVEQWGLDERDEAHVASWSPDVARAVADLLDHWHRTFETIGWPGPLAQATSPVFDIARKFLGES